MLDNTDESDVIKTGMAKMRREFDLDNEPIASITELDKFKQQLEQLKYAAVHESQLDDITTATQPTATETLPVTSFSNATSATASPPATSQSKTA